MGSDTIIFLLGPAHAFRRGAPLPQSFDLFPEALAAQRPSLCVHSRISARSLSERAALNNL